MGQCPLKSVNMSIISCVYIYMYYVKSVNMSRSLVFYVFIYVCTMLRVLICQGVYYFMCLYIYICVLC